MTTVTARPRRETLPRLRYVGKTAGRKLLDRQAQRMLNISGDEFLRRWDAGQYIDQVNNIECTSVRRLARLIPFAR